MTRMPANSYAVFAFGMFLGIWPAKSAAEALHDAAYDEGLDNPTGMTAHLMTEDDWKALTQRHEAGCPAGTLPMFVREAAQCSS